MKSKEKIEGNLLNNKNTNIVKTHACVQLFRLWFSWVYLSLVLGSDAISVLFMVNILINGIKILKSLMVYLPIYVLV